MTLLVCTFNGLIQAYAASPVSKDYVDVQIQSLQTQISNLPVGRVYSSGTGISIDGNIISNTAPGMTYTAGTGIKISGNTISNSAPAIVYTAGSGISINGTTISSSSAASTSLPCTTSDPRCGAFVSNNFYDGSLASNGINNPMNLSACGAGVTGASCGDDLCNREGQTRFGSTTRWVAWLSTASRDAKSMIKTSASYFRDNSSVILFTTSSDGTPQYRSGQYSSAILFDIFSAATTSSWTGTTAAGVYDGNGSCASWTNNTGSNNAGEGNTSKSDSSWTQQDSTNCLQLNKLYCMQITS